MEGQRKFLGTLYNTYAFYVLYAEIDQFDPTKYVLDDCRLTVMDRYILSVLNSTVAEVDRRLSAYQIPEAARALSACVDELSNWYVRRCRERYWVQGMPEDKIAAYMTLYTALVTLAKTAAPMIPFMADEIYRNLVCSVDKSAPISVHLCDFPTVDESRIDPALEENMQFVVDVVVMGRAARNGANRKTRQPLAALYIKADRTVEPFFCDIIADELNVKKVEFVDDVSAFSSYSFKPQLRTIGPKYGKLLGQIRAALSDPALDGNRAMAELNETGALHFTFGDATVELTKDDLLIDVQQKPGYYSMAEGNITIALDTNLTDALIREGYIREVTSKIQTMRKEAGFVVTDHIHVYVTGAATVCDLLGTDSAEVCAAVLADSMNLTSAADGVGYTKEWDINGENVTITVVKA